MARRSSRNALVMVLVLIVGLAWVLPAFADKSSNTLNFAWTKELETLDRYYNTAREGMIVSRHVYDDLIYRDPQTWEYKPLLATSWKWIDPVTMELELRKGVVFHNGEKFDADDVVFTLNFVSDPEKMEVNLDDPYILLHEKKISSMKMMKNAEMWEITSWDTGSSPILTLNTACGCMNSRISSNTFFRRTSTRMFFIPPPVDPAHPPTNINRITIVRAAELYAV